MYNAPGLKSTTLFSYNSAGTILNFSGNDLQSLNFFVFRCADNTITVQVGDVNDNAPVMADKRIDVSFREDIKIGSKLFQVYATDRDDPVNYGKLRYRLENEQSYYSIDAETGEVFLRANFDYETARSDEVRDRSIHQIRAWYEKTIKMM